MTLLFQHGVFSTKDEDYFVEPLWNHTNNIKKDGHPHVVYKRSSLILPNTNSHCGVKGKCFTFSILRTCDMQKLEQFSMGTHGKKIRECG